MTLAPQEMFYIATIILVLGAVSFYILFKNKI